MEEVKMYIIIARSLYSVPRHFELFGRFLFSKA